MNSKTFQKKINLKKKSMCAVGSSCDAVKKSFFDARWSFSTLWTHSRRQWITDQSCNQAMLYSYPDNNFPAHSQSFILSFREQKCTVLPVRSCLPKSRCMRMPFPFFVVQKSTKKLRLTRFRSGYEHPAVKEGVLQSVH